MTDMWNLKCDTKDLFTKQTQKLAGVENKLMITKGERLGRDTFAFWD